MFLKHRGIMHWATERLSRSCNVIGQCTGTIKVHEHWGNKRQNKMRFAYFQNKNTYDKLDGSPISYFSRCYSEMINHGGHLTLKRTSPVLCH
jgi:hypothetical protein